MAINACLTQKYNALEEFAEASMSRANSMQAFLNRNIFRIYQEAQKQRWITENLSESGSYEKAGQWEQLKSAAYKKRKLKKYAEFPGQGTKLMIATNKLSSSAMGIYSGGLNKITTNNSITIAINTSFVKYAAYAAKLRPIMKFGDRTKALMKTEIKKYLSQGST